MEDTLRAGSRVYTDEYRGYNDLGLDYEHYQVAHKRGEYVRDDVHTNGIESFWALIKRGYYGTYHWMSRKHLHRYVNEFTGRQNSRHMAMIGPDGADGPTDGRRTIIICRFDWTGGGLMGKSRKDRPRRERRESKRVKPMSPPGTPDELAIAV